MKTVGGHVTCDCGCEIPVEEIPGIHTRFSCGCWVIVRGKDTLAVGVCKRHMAHLHEVVTNGGLDNGNANGEITGDEGDRDEFRRRRHDLHSDSTGDN